MGKSAWEREREAEERSRMKVGWVQLELFSQPTTPWGKGIYTKSEDKKMKATVRAAVYTETFEEWVKGEDAVREATEAFAELVKNRWEADIEDLVDFDHEIEIEVEVVRGDQRSCEPTVEIDADEEEADARGDEDAEGEVFEAILAFESAIHGALTDPQELWTEFTVEAEPSEGIRAFEN